LRRPEADHALLMSALQDEQTVLPEAVVQQVEIQAKYEGYVNRQADEIARQQKQENVNIPDDFDYHVVNSLSNEVREKLNRIKPQTVGQAARIAGVTPAAISLLLIYLKKHSHERNKLSNTDVA